MNQTKRKTLKLVKELEALVNEAVADSHGNRYENVPEMFIEQADNIINKHRELTKQLGAFLKTYGDPMACDVMNEMLQAG